MFTAGKGTVGTAWETSRAVHKDWTKICDRWDGKNPTEQDFEKMSAKTRANFTYQEFVSMLGKYSEVLAIPIKNEGTGKIEGVLSVDVSRHATNTTPVLDNREIVSLFEEVIGLVRPDLA